MKKMYLLVTGLALVATAVFTPDAMAQEGKLKPAVVAVVDMQKLQENSQAYKGLMVQKDKALAEIKSEAEKDEANLRTLEQKITKERAVLTQEELTKKTEDFRNKVMDFQKKYKDKEEALYKAVMEANMKIQDNAFNPAIREIVDAKGIDVIIGNSQLAYFAPALDITDEVGALMNKKLPSVDFKSPVAPKAKKK